MVVAMKRSSARAWLAIASTLTAVWLGSSLGCGSTPPPKRPTTRAIRTPKPTAPAPKQPDIAPLLPSYVVAELTDENATPYFARRGQEGLLLYNVEGRWKTRLVRENGEPKSSDAIDVGPTAAGVPFASIRAAAD